MKALATTRSWHTPAWALLIAAAAFAAYWPSLHGGFIWDDDVLLTNNPLIKTAAGLHRLWFTTEAVDYWPVTGTSFWVEWRLWDSSPAGYHVTNLLLHIGCAFVLWAILVRLLIPGARLAALLFAVHPVNVESVAWIAQRKNTLSLVFFLSAILWYLFDDRPSTIPHSPPARQADRRSESSPTVATRPGAGGVTRWYWLSLAAFAFAMLSKGSVAILPMVLLLLAWWQRGTVTRRDVMRTLPFFAVSVVLTLVNLWFQAHRSLIAIRDASWLQRALGAGAVVWFYLHKALLPINLSFIYPQWDIQASDVWWWAPLGAAIVVTGALVRYRRQPVVRALLFAWIFFCIALVPVLGMSDVYFMRYSLVADHYQYIALTAVAAAVAAGLSWVSSLSMRSALAVRVLGSVLLILLGAATWQRSHQYADAGTLYRATLQTNPQCWLCETNLAVPLIARGRQADLAEALAHLHASLAMNPDDSPTHDALGVALQKSGRFSEAIEEHQRALALNPYFAEARANLAMARHSQGVVLSRDGRFGDASVAFEEALQDAPSRAATHRELGYALLQLGRTDAAFAEVSTALRLDPASAETHDTLAAIWRARQRSEQAVIEYREAVRLAPNEADWHNNLGSALLETDRVEEAASEFQAAVRCDPANALAHRNLGVTLETMGRLDDAGEQLQRAMQLQPDVADARDQLDALRRRMRKK